MCNAMRVENMPARHSCLVFGKVLIHVKAYQLILIHLGSFFTSRTNDIEIKSNSNCNTTDIWAAVLAAAVTVPKATGPSNAHSHDYVISS